MNPDPKPVVYDGTFAGWCAACGRLLAEASAAPLYWRVGSEEAGEDLFENAGMLNWPADDSNLNLFFTLLEPAGGRKLIYDLLCLFLSEALDRETLMFQMVQISLEQGQQGRKWHGHPDMRRAGILIDRVRHEAHRSKGLLRFMELRDGTLYARYAPSHDVTPLVAGHFRRRMPRDRWVIHDEARHYGVAWDGAAFHEAGGFPPGTAEQFTEAESRYQACWRAFFRELEIPERRNLRLQRHFLPERFRKYLPELD